MQETLREFELKTIGVRLAQARHRRKLTQKEVSAYLGIDITTYNGYEWGRRAFPVYMARTLCAFLHIRPDALFGAPNAVPSPSQREAELLEENRVLWTRVNELASPTCTARHWRTEELCVLPWHSSKEDHESARGLTWGCAN